MTAGEINRAVELILRADAKVSALLVGESVIHLETNPWPEASGAHPGDTPRRRRTSVVRSRAWARISKKSVSQ